MMNKPLAESPAKVQERKQLEARAARKEQLRVEFVEAYRQAEEDLWFFEIFGRSVRCA